MRGGGPFAVLLGLAALLVTSGVEARTQHYLHRHHAHRHHDLIVRGTSPRFVFSTPDGAARASSAGQFGGAFETGIPGATTADPYQRPAYGYDANGVYRRGYSY